MSLSEEDVVAYNIASMVTPEQQAASEIKDMPTATEITDHEAQIVQDEADATIQVATDDGILYEQDLRKVPYKLGLELESYVFNKLTPNLLKMQALFQKFRTDVEAGSETSEFNATTPGVHYAALTEILLKNKPEILDVLTYDHVTTIGRIVSSFFNSNRSRSGGVTKK